MFPPRILIASMNATERDQWAQWLADRRVVVNLASAASELRTKVRALRPDLLVLGPLESGDGEIAGARPQATAFDICREHQGDLRKTRMMILMIVDGEVSQVEQAVRVGADDLLTRPVKRQEFQSRVDLMLALLDVRDCRDPL